MNDLADKIKSIVPIEITPNTALFIELEHKLENHSDYENLQRQLSSVLGCNVIVHQDFIKDISVINIEEEENTNE